MDRRGLANKTARDMVALLRRSYRPQQVILFGSLAGGRWTGESDIDLLIVKRTSLPFYRRMAKVREVVSSVRRGHAFDPIVLTPREVKARLARGDKFIEGILANGKVLHGSSAN